MISPKLHRALPRDRTLNLHRQDGTLSSQRGKGLAEWRLVLHPAVHSRNIDAPQRGLVRYRQRARN
ncbi:MAG TPA: hypothetical protein VNF24_02260 [Candidatus Acidoferrales bacterium]|nr:hypothetical protein [Candidatus Acidoferrales bacterium]